MEQGAATRINVSVSCFRRRTLSRSFKLAGSRAFFSTQPADVPARRRLSLRRPAAKLAAWAAFFGVAPSKRDTWEGNSLLGGQHHGVAVQAVHVVVVPPGLLGVHAQGLAVHHLVQDLWREKAGGGGGENSGKLRTNGAKYTTRGSVPFPPLSSSSYPGQVHFADASPGI